MTPFNNSDAQAVRENVRSRNAMTSSSHAFIRCLTSRDRSLFIFSEHNFIRKYAKVIIEWGYPFVFIQHMH
jgi:hypothetical protein